MRTPRADRVHHFVDGFLEFGARRADRLQEPRRPVGILRERQLDRLDDELASRQPLRGRSAIEGIDEFFREPNAGGVLGYFKIVLRSYCG